MEQVMANRFEDFAIILSQRERQVIRMVVQGLKSKEIAELLKISIRTVEVHRYNALRKAGVKNSVQLVAKMVHRVVL